MNAVGIDVSKGKSTVAIMRPFGEVVAESFEVAHTDAELRKLACFLEKLPGETRIVMEYTGNYWQPIAKVLHDAGIFVSIVNALLILSLIHISEEGGAESPLPGVHHRQNQPEAGTKRLPHLVRRESVLRASGVRRQRCGSRGPRQHVGRILRGEADRSAPNIVPKEGYGRQPPALPKAHTETDDGRGKCSAGTGKSN